MVIRCTSGANEITIAQILQKAGYATGHFGKWHCNGKFNSPGSRSPAIRALTTGSARRTTRRPSHHNPDNFVRNGQRVGPTEGYSCQIVTDEAIGWLTRSGRRTSRSSRMSAFMKRTNRSRRRPSWSPNIPNAEEREPGDLFCECDQRRSRSAAPLETLDEMGEADRTFVMFTSDNGPETFERYPNGVHCYGSPGPLRGMKLHIYEGGIRVPCIVRWPGHTKPGAGDRRAGWSLDLLPTFAEIAACGRRPAIAILTERIVCAFRGTTRAETHAAVLVLLCRADPTQGGTAEGDWKLVAHWDITETFSSVTPEAIRAIKRAKLTDFELYNLREDIGEKHDVARQQPERVQICPTACASCSDRSRRKGRSGPLPRRRLARLAPRSSRGAPSLFHALCRVERALKGLSPSAQGWSPWANYPGYGSK